MPDQPLQPFVSPSTLFSHFNLPAGVSSGVAVEWLLYAVFAFWAFYTLIAAYHWLKYSHGALVALPAIVVHLALSFSLMSYALSGNAWFLSTYLP